MTDRRIGRRERFCREYVKDLDAKAAALRAGYPADGNIRRNVSRLLGDARVRERIAALQEAIARQAAADVRAEAGWVVAQLVKIARADPRKFFHAGGAPKKVHELGDDEAAALAGFGASGEAGKVVDRLKVLELLGRHFGVWPHKPAPPPPPPPQEVNPFEGLNIDEVERIRDKVGRLLQDAGVDLPGYGPPRRRQG